MFDSKHHVPLNSLFPCVLITYTSPIHLRHSHIWPFTTPGPRPLRKVRLPCLDVLSLLDSNMGILTFTSPHGSGVSSLNVLFFSLKTRIGMT